MDFPESLTAAAALAEAAWKRHAAVADAAAKMVADAAAWRSRAAALGEEIDSLRGAVLGDEALAAAGIETQMTATDRAVAQRRLDALCAERAELKQRAEDAGIGGIAVRNMAPAREAEIIDTGRSLVQEMRSFVAALDLEFHRDVARLPLPDLFSKWLAIGEALANRSKIDRLLSLKLYRSVVRSLDGSIAATGGAILNDGKYFDLDTQQAVDWHRAWRSDPALVELNRSLAHLVFLERRVAPMVAAANAAAARSRSLVQAGAPAAATAGA